MQKSPRETDQSWFAYATRLMASSQRPGDLGHAAVQLHVTALCLDYQDEVREGGCMRKKQVPRRTNSQHGVRVDLTGF